VRHVAVLGDDLEPLDRLGVADNVVEEYGSVLFDPVTQRGRVLAWCCQKTWSVLLFLVCRVRALVSMAGMATRGQADIPWELIVGGAIGGTSQGLLGGRRGGLADLFLGNSRHGSLRGVAVS
jgi:hypothetical protein